MSSNFQDVMVNLDLLWKSSQEEVSELKLALEGSKNEVLSITKTKQNIETETINLRYQVETMSKEIEKLSNKIKDVEDDQKQFTKVSHIVSMERENNKMKQQITILEKRVAFYQNLCNTYKDSMKSPSQCINIQDTKEAENTIIDTVKNDKHETNNIELSKTDMTSNTEIVSNIREDNINSPCKISTLHVSAVKVKEDETCDNEKNHVHDKTEDNAEGDLEENTSDTDNDINVVEKKIKGVIYYLGDNGDLYNKHSDETIGELCGKIESLPSGKTKVKWFKTSL
jgi:hypothetical protein